MTALIENLDELDLLVKAARQTRMKPSAFAAAFRTAMGKTMDLMQDQYPDGFLDADGKLTKCLLDYEANPDLSGIGRIGNALVSYRRTAMS